MDTASFYMDGSPKREMSLFAREKPGAIHWPDFQDEIDNQLIQDNSKEVKILIPMGFFYVEQPGITLGKLREFFTEKAIALYVKYDYAKIL